MSSKSNNPNNNHNNNNDMMYVVKRSGALELVDSRKITERLAALAAAHFFFPRSPWASADDRTELRPLDKVDCADLADEVALGLHDRIPTAQLDELAEDLAASRGGRHPQYQLLAARLAVSALHKSTQPHALDVWRRLQTTSVVHRRAAPPLRPEFLADAEWLAEHAPDVFAAAAEGSRDYLLEHFGLCTLRQAYLLRLRSATDPLGAVVERPQHLFLRVAVAMHGRDAERVRETYDMLSLRMCAHATPTLFNSGTVGGQLASCFLMPVSDDSLDGIMDTNKECAAVSKSSGGIGLSVSNVRARGSGIVSTGGTSNGLVGMLRMYERTVRYVDQGGGKRPGSLAVYIEPWHADVLDVVGMRRNSCPEETCARHLFYALYLPDLFMRRLIAGRPWSLFCPDECPGLQDAHGAEFDALYEHYEAEGRARAVVQPNEIWEAALASASETGVPYIVYKDAVNRACNQSALGTIRSSNLCCEITQFSGPDEIAVCNLASLALPAAVRAGTAAALDPATALDPTTGLLDRRDARVDHALLERMAYAATINLNRVLDASRAPLEKARRSNERHRAVGLGVQGLADVFCLLGLDFDSVEARAVNRALFETVYFGALSASADLAERDGPYDTFWDSPAARGQLQFDLLAEPWIERPEESAPGRRRAGQPAWAPGADSRHDWAALKRRIQLTGLRNSLVVALMPTASTSQILGYNECFEPFTKNVYQRKTQAGLYTLVNRYLVQDLEALGRWVPGETNLQLLAAKGSLTGVPDLPAALLRRYRTADELPMKAVIDLAADRQAFVCQSQSMNLWMPKPDFTRLTKMHLYAWRAGLKTGQYYLHTEPHAAAQQFAVVPQQQQQQQQQCSADEEGVCASCSA